MAAASPTIRNVTITDNYFGIAAYAGAYTIKATAGKGITYPAAMTLDHTGKWKIPNTPPEDKKSKEDQG